MLVRELSEVTLLLKYVRTLIRPRIVRGRYALDQTEPGLSYDRNV